MEKPTRKRNLGEQRLVSALRARLQAGVESPVGALLRRRCTRRESESTLADSMPLRTTLPSNDESGFELRERSQPALFLAFECDGLAAGPARYLLGEVDVAMVGRGPSRRAEIEETAGTRKLQITLPDPRISSAHFSIRRPGGGWELTDAGARNGTIVNRSKVE